MLDSKKIVIFCIAFLLCSFARAQSPAETRTFVATIANGTPQQQRAASKKNHTSHKALLAEAKRVNDIGTPDEKAQFAFVLALFDVDHTGNRARLLQMGRSKKMSGMSDALPSYLFRLYDQKHEIVLLEALLTLHGDGALAENLSDAEIQLCTQRPAVALRLIASDTKRFNQAAETIAEGVWMQREGLTQAAFQKRKPFPELRKASLLASPSSQRTYQRFVAAAYSKYKPMGK